VFRGKNRTIWSWKIWKKLYENLSQKDGVEVVLWVDKNYMKLDSEHIQSPEDVRKPQFDYILIAVCNMEVRQEIYNELICVGIQTSKIL